MANSDFLRKNKNQHSVKNSISKKMDGDIDVAIATLIRTLKKRHPELTFEHKKKLFLTEIIANLSPHYPEMGESFAKVMKESFIKPDGGFLYATDKSGKKHIILIAEVKRQGTNDKRLREGLKKQSKGNAIERLGKNMIGIRAIFKNEAIIPFVCFGCGDDFQDGSTIRDRVITINEFFPLNKFFITKNHSPFEPVSMFFHQEDWTTLEMFKIMERIAEAAIEHYFPIR
jgi:type II restriction enzyme